MFGCRVWVCPSLSSWRTFGPRVMDVCLLPSSSNRITNVFAVKGQDIKPLYQSTGKRDNFKGFCTCVFGCRLDSPFLSSWRTFGHKCLPRCLLPSSSNRITMLLPWKGNIARLCISRLGIEIISEAFVRVWLPRLRSPCLLLVVHLKTEFWPYAFYHHL